MDSFVNIRDLGDIIQSIESLEWRLNNRNLEVGMEGLMWFVEYVGLADIPDRRALAQIARTLGCVESYRLFSWLHRYC